MQGRMIDLWDAFWYLIKTEFIAPSIWIYVEWVSLLKANFRFPVYILFTVHHITYSKSTFKMLKKKSDWLSRLKSLWPVCFVGLVLCSGATQKPNQTTRWTFFSPFIYVSPILALTARPAHSTLVQVHVINTSRLHERPNRDRCLKSAVTQIAVTVILKVV